MVDPLPVLSQLEEEDEADFIQEDEGLDEMVNRTAEAMADR